MLFRADDKDYFVHPHVAEMVALLGFPPKALLERGTKTTHLFDEKGLSSGAS